MASKEIAAGTRVEIVYVKSETAMCWIIIIKILLILKVMTQKTLTSEVVVYVSICYVPRRAKVVNILAVRQVKQGTETAKFRTGSTLHP